MCGPSLKTNWSPAQDARGAAYRDRPGRGPLGFDLPAPREHWRSCIGLSIELQRTFWREGQQIGGRAQNEETILNQRLTPHPSVLGPRLSLIAFWRSVLKLIWGSSAWFGWRRGGYGIFLFVCSRLSRSWKGCALMQPCPAQLRFTHLVYIICFWVLQFGLLRVGIPLLFCHFPFVSLHLLSLIFAPPTFLPACHPSISCFRLGKSLDEMVV